MKIKRIDWTSVFFALIFIYFTMNAFMFLIGVDL